MSVKGGFAAALLKSIIWPRRRQFMMQPIWKVLEGVPFRGCLMGWVEMFQMDEGALRVSSGADISWLPLFVHKPP